MKSMKIDEKTTSWDRAKVSIGAGPRCHKGPQAAKLSVPRIQTSEHMKSMKIDEIAASWDRAKVYIGAASRQQTSVTSDLEIHEIS